MAYSIELEHRIDNYAAQVSNIKKKKMFGGIAYLLNGNMCFGIIRNYLIIRTTKVKADSLIDEKNIKVFDITGRPMKGWIMVKESYVDNEKSLIKFLDIGNEFAYRLPPK